MLDFAITDTHVHLWDTNRLHYGWLEGNSRLGRPFLLEDFDRARGEIAVERIVFVECDISPEQRLREAQWVNDLAVSDQRIKGIVASAPMELGEGTRPHLEALSQIPLVKGIRRLVQGESVSFCAEREFVRGVQLLSEFGFSFDICIRHTQLPATTLLVSQCPDTQFMLDHIGKPLISEGVMEPWASGVRKLASYPNVWCKVSGLVTEADRELWKPEDLKPYIDHVIDCFGWERVVYGGDWPVAIQAADYPDWVAALDWAVQGCVTEQRRALFDTNAIRFYRLGE